MTDRTATVTATRTARVGSSRSSLVQILATRVAQLAGRRNSSVQIAASSVVLAPVAVPSPTPTPGGSGTGRLGPNFGTPGGDSLRGGLAVALKALRLRAALVLGSVLAISRLRVLALLLASSTLTARLRGKAALQSTLSNSAVRISVGNVVAAKDCAVAIPTGCVGAGNNRNGGKLVVDGVATMPVVSYLAFDLTKFPVGGTVLSALLTLKASVVPLTSQSMTLSPLANADEGWSETAIVCNGRPTPAASLQTLAGPTAVGDVAIPLNAGWLARLSARCGVGVCSVVLQNAALNLLSTTFDDRESGATGPRLTLTVQLP